MNLIQIREKIDNIDDTILELLLERFNLMEAIAEYKFKSDKPVADEKRESEVLRKIEAKSLEDYKYIKSIFINIINESKNKQIDIINVSKKL